MHHPLTFKARLFLCAISFLIADPVVAQDDGFFDDFPKPGLIGTYRDADGHTAVRVDAGLAFDWEDAAPDPRIDNEQFSATWEGQLLVRTTGTYRFASYSIGQASIEIDDESVLGSKSMQREWIAGDAVALRAGMHDLTIRFQKSADAAAMRLFWSSDTFGWEPMNPANTLHEIEDEPEDGFARGHALAEAFRCAACHEIGGASPPLAAPALNRLTGNLHPSWVVQRLMQKTAAADAATKMPHFGMTEAESKAVAAYLFDLSKEHKPAKPAAVKQPKPKRGQTLKKPVERGHDLFVGLGCLACHEKGNLGTQDLLGGGSLENVTAKRPDDYFARWLSNPSAINEHHRMPQFAISDLEASDLATYLQQDAAKTDADAAPSWMSDQSLIATGRQLVSRNRCASCHEIEESLRSEPSLAKIALDSETDWTQACTGVAGNDRPHYALGEKDQQAVKAAVSAVLPNAEVRFTGADVLRRSNCLACHPRNLGEGNSKLALAIASQNSEAFEHAAVLTPPSLNSIGDKLKDASLQQAVRGQAPQRRPWLQVRMPKFRFSDQEADQLAQWFVDQDRIPEQPQDQHATKLSDEALLAVGPRLVTSNGFGCASCHTIGEVSPAKAPVNSRGPNLAGLGEHVRKEWFDRWVADPLRVVPRVEMPAIKVPVDGLLHDDLDQQINAVWQVLNLEGFRPPSPDAVRVVRHDGHDNAAHAHVLTDVLRVGETQYIKPFLVGLPNRNNILFNLAEAKLEAWWLGDTASQYTEGKSWHWEAGGANLLNSASTNADFALVSDDGNSTLPPVRQRQFITQPDAWHAIPGGLEFEYRLTFDNAGDSPIVVRVIEQYAAASSDSGASGWSRQITATGIPDGWALRLQAAPDDFQPTASGSLQAASNSKMQVVAASETTKFDAAGKLMLRSGQPVRLQYLADLPVDRLPKIDVAVPGPEAITLNVVPGFSAVQLALPHDIMPVAMAWRDAKTMFIADLKGRVFRGEDTDGDQIPDGVTQVSDELAAPFGLNAGEDYLDVITKFALLRLHDDGRVENLVSGWGHTSDYHDWATGLPQDSDGNYFIALACQQDTRTQPAAYLRGTVLQLNPRQPTADNPQHFDIEVLSGGHRFPIGIARTAAGDLFVTDNQGNYNPFNELNHVMKGHRYGFINRLERKDGFDPPLTAPAIDIPHPWTRSVNGICFLETPAGLQTKPFGPFEGHLIGCEYDTRRLVRMSLEKVGDTIQGAAYPFSYDQPPTGPAMLGPISAAVSLDGALVIGNIRDSGWGAGQNTGSVVRMELVESELPAGIREVRATPTGFVVDFTGEIAAGAAADAGNYAIQSYTRESTPAYGGDDKNNRSEAIASVAYDAGKRQAVIELKNELRPDYVYELNLKPLVQDPATPFFPDRAFYTLRTVPK